VTIGDMVQVQRRLIDHLGVEKLLAVVGGSMGGMMALQWAIEHPDRVGSAVLIATTHRLSAQAVAFDVVGRNAILKDPNYRGGQYYDDGPAPVDGLAIARMIGHITYLSDQSMASKFDSDRESPRDVAYAFEKEFSVGSYLAYQGGRFVERFDANSYLTLSLAMDHFDVARDHGSLPEAMAKARARFLVLSFSSDWLFPPGQSRAMVDAMIAADRDVSYCNIETDCGHDAFLLATDLNRYGPLLGGFLAHGRDNPSAAAALGEPGGYRDQPDVRSIYHGPRLDLQTVEGLIPDGASVLDLGCGGGLLLRRLRRQNRDRLLGLEVDPDDIIACVNRGLNVVQLNLDTGLSNFRDKQFDVVLLSQTLQTVLRPEKVLLEMLRVGKTCIVSFPNFAYREAVRELVEEGVAPVTGGLPFKWYRTPNLHYLTIKDFENFCDEFGVSVHRRVALETATGQRINDDPNRNADVAVFVISRG
jgi:homoserine O-acetyltransferase